MLRKDKYQQQIEDLKQQIEHQQNQEYLKEITIENLFEKYKENDVIEIEGFSKAIDDFCSYHCIDNQRKRDLFDVADVNEDGQLDKSEFIRMLTILDGEKILSDERYFLILFKYLDKDNSKTLDREEFKKLYLYYFGKGTDEEIEKMFNSIDTDGNNSIDEDEFLEYFIEWKKQKIRDLCDEMKKEDFAMKCIERKKQRVDNIIKESERDVLKYFNKKHWEDLKEKYQSFKIKRILRYFNEYLHKNVIKLYKDEDVSSALKYFEYDRSRLINLYVNEMKDEIMFYFVDDEDTKYFEEMFEKYKNDDLLNIDTFKRIFMLVVDSCYIESAPDMIFKVISGGNKEYVNFEDCVRALSIVNGMKITNITTVYALIFLILDRDNSSSISRNEFDYFFGLLDFDLSEKQQIYNEIDMDGNGTIEYIEFMEWIDILIETLLIPTSSTVKKGEEEEWYVISESDFLVSVKDKLGNILDDQSLKYIFSLADKDMNGTLSRTEYYNLMKVLYKKNFEDKETYFLTLFQLIEKPRANEMNRSEFTILYNIWKLNEEKGINEDIDKLYDEIDKNHDGSIQLDEFLDYKFPNRLDAKLQKLFHKNQVNGSINDVKFSLAFHEIISYCKFDDASLVVFDSSKIDDKFMDLKEFIRVMKFIHNKTITKREELYELVFDLRKGIDELFFLTDDENDMNAVLEAFGCDKESIEKEMKTSKVLTYKKFLEIIPKYDLYYLQEKNYDMKEVGSHSVSSEKSMREF